jgi:oligopeptide transport system ATP-binding protein
MIFIRRKKMKQKNENILEIKDLSKYFNVKEMVLSNKHSKLKAVNKVTFNIKKGETLGIVGESGCGKTTLGRTIIWLYEPTSGKIIYNGKEITEKNIKHNRKNIQMIFQDPYASLNPRMTVSDIIGESLAIHKIGDKNERKEKIYTLLEKVGLDKYHANRYPHEFSGGQRQRIGIARSLATEPNLIICDEPISALDVSIQAQIVNMLEDLKETMGLTYLFIAHDLSMVKHISDNVGVMYLGKLIELTTSDELYKKPAHPYTQALLSAVPIADPNAKRKSRIVLKGEVPNPINPPKGCHFRTRCKYAMKKCAEEEPKLKEISKGHKCACYLY